MIGGRVIKFDVFRSNTRIRYRQFLNIGIIRGKTMDDKFMHIPNGAKQNFTLFILQLTATPLEVSRGTGRRGKTFIPF